MNCPRCGAWMWGERDPDYDWVDAVCICGHRVTLDAPEPMPYLHHYESGGYTVKRRKARHAGMELT